MHMRVSVALIPPVVLKLASTGYRFMRYFAGSVLAGVVVAAVAAPIVAGWHR
jgi:hypothetical protein